MEIVDTYSPSEAAMEQMFFMKRAITVSYTIQTRGVILLACHMKGLGITSYSPKKIKSLISGSGSASKDQVQRMVQLTLGLDKKPEPDDVADAIAIGIGHIKLSPIGIKIQSKSSFQDVLKKAAAAQIKKKTSN
ncbi:crossover junction endodeoxyribonuclease RuvC [Parelusimicrobium proximum]